MCITTKIHSWKRVGRLACSLATFDLLYASPKNKVSSPCYRKLNIKIEAKIEDTVITAFRRFQLHNLHCVLTNKIWVIYLAPPTERHPTNKQCGRHIRNETHKNAKRWKQHIRRCVACTSRELEELDLALAEVFTCQDPTSNSGGTAQKGPYGRGHDGRNSLQTQTEDGNTTSGRRCGGQRKTEQATLDTECESGTAVCRREEGMAKPGAQWQHEWSNHMVTSERESRQHFENAPWKRLSVRSVLPFK